MAMTEESMAIGVFRDHATAEQAVQELRSAGFENDQVNLFGRSNGNIFEGIRNFFSGKNDATDADTNLVNAGIAQEDMSFYQRELEGGNFVVTVLPHGHLQEAQDILNRYGAYNASSDTETTNSVADETMNGTQATNTEIERNETPAITTDAMTNAGTTQVIPLREERLRVDKQVVQSGEVIIRKRVITENKTFTIPVRREEVTIERRSLNGNSAMENGRTSISDEANTTSDETIVNMIDGSEMLSRDGNIRVLVREEQVTFDKKTVVVEEIVVSKQQVQETTPFTDTVRREEAHVEHTGDVIVHDENMNKNA